MIPARGVYRETGRNCLGGVHNNAVFLKTATSETTTINDVLGGHDADWETALIQFEGSNAGRLFSSNLTVEGDC